MVSVRILRPSRRSCPADAWQAEKCETVLEVRFQAELQDSRRIGGRDLPEQRTVQRRRRTQQVRVIQAVEALRPKFQLHGFRESEEPRYRRIQIRIRWAHKLIRTRVPIRPGRVLCEGGGVEPVL